MAKAKTQPEKLTFEQQLLRLEEIVEGLDRGEVPLEDMMKLYEEGMKLLQTCHTYLSTTEQKISIIQGTYTVGIDAPGVTEEKEENTGEDLQLYL